MPADDPRLVLTTVGSLEEASRIARLVVEERLAACVNIVPGVQSFYWWEGRVNIEEELVLLIKTTAGMVEALETRLGEIHPYDLPEFVVLEPEGLSARYGQWIVDSVRPS
jgi:periplasmic divalent cation tolerance protein